QATKHVGDNVFTPEEEVRQDRFGAAVLRNIEGLAHEHFCRRWNLSVVERLGQRNLGLDSGQEAAEYAAVGADFIHGREVQVQVTVKFALGMLVGLFTVHDFVDQAGGGDVYRRYPGQLHAGEIVLDTHEQGHAVPHSEHVKFHQG